MQDIKFKLSPMKITFVLPPVGLSGGIRVIAILSERLSQMGHEVQVVSISKPKPTPLRQLKSVLHGKGLIANPQPQQSHFDGRKVNHKILPHSGPVTDADVPDADVVIATWWETAPWVANLSPSKGAKAYFMQDYGKAGQELKDVAPTWSLPLYIITISEWLANLIKEYCGDIPLAVVPMAVDQEQFFAPPRQKQSPPVVGFTYRQAHSKGIDIGVKAISLARQTIPELGVLAFGPQNPSDNLSLPPNTEYHFRPPDENIPHLYSSCDMWLFTSRREGFGLPILEAMSCRTPVIGTPAGAAPEIITPEVGILVPPEDPVAMAKGIQQISQLSEQQWQQLSERAFHRANIFNWEKSTQLFESALSEAIKSST